MRTLCFVMHRDKEETGRGCKRPNRRQVVKQKMRSTMRKRYGSASRLSRM